MASRFRKPLSASTKATLRRKAKASKRYTYGTLAKVSRRVPMAAWSMGRVNSFLRGSRKHDLDLRKKKK